MNYDVCEIYSYSQRLNRILENIQKAEISESNKKALVKYQEDLTLEGLSLGRVLRYLHSLLLFSKWFKKDFEKADIESIRSFITMIEKSDRYSDWSKYGWKITIRKFFKWLKKTEKYPEEVAWIKPRIRANNHKLPEELLTEEEIKRLVEATKDPKERALISVLYESGCRIGEILTLRIKSITFDQYGAQLTVNGKTGQRRVRIVSSVPYLTEWLNKHPLKNDTNSWVWINKWKGVMKYNSVMDVLRRLRLKANITKPINPHNFRHSRATYLANFLTEAQMKEMFGWVKNSEMASVYVHLSGRDVDKALLKTYGIELENKKQETELKPKMCPRCEIENPVTNKFCNQCGTILDEETRLEIIKKDIERKEADNILDKLIQDEEFKKMFLERVKEVASLN